jgi:hypothetical protein
VTEEGKETPPRREQPATAFILLREENSTLPSLGDCCLLALSLVGAWELCRVGVGDAGGTPVSHLSALRALRV